MKGIDNFGQHVLIIVIFQLWNICLFPLFTWVYSFYSYTYRSVDAKVTKTVYTVVLEIIARYKREKYELLNDRIVKYHINFRVTLISYGTN